MTARRGAPKQADRPGSSPLVFVSYCREDAEWLRRFEVMLKPEARSRGMQLWTDTLIAASRRWRWELEDAITRADVALLLVVRAVAFSPDGATLASGGADGEVRLWDHARATQIALLQGYSGAVNALAFSPDGATLANAGHDGSLRLWDLTDVTQAALPEGHRHGVRGVAFSPDGAVLAASAGDDGTVRLWEVADATQIALLEGHSGWVRAIAFSLDGATLATAGDDGSLRLWDLADATLVVSVRLEES